MPHLAPAPTDLISPPAESGRSIVPHLQRTEIFREYVKAYETTTGLPLALRQIGTFQSPLHQSRNVNGFCALMAASNQTCAACLRMQQQMETDATHDARTFQCFAGLTESAVPVRVGETVFGHLQTGQVLLRAPNKSQFARVVRQLAEWKVETDLPRLEAAFFATRVVAKKQYESMVRLIAVFAQHLGTLGNQLIVQEAAAEMPAIARARTFIAEHQSELLSLSQVARAVNMSGFYFCKVFKRATGLTFTDYVARSRVETVKKMLLNPHTRVSEAAYAAGFQSLSQFNRVFRRVAGESPSAYRDRLHGPAHGSGLAHAA
jgi:AraC-like DNA-binding protein